MHETILLILVKNN